MSKCYFVSEVGKDDERGSFDATLDTQREESGLGMYRSAGLHSTKETFKGDGTGAGFFEKNRTQNWRKL